MPSDAPSARVLFEQSTTSPETAALFQQSDLAAVYVYMRGCTSLSIPEEWRVLIPVKTKRFPCTGSQGTERPCKAARTIPK